MGRGRCRGIPGLLVAAGLATGCLAAACGEQKPKEQNIRDVVEAQDRARAVKAQADLQAIRTALQQHLAEQGSYPARLEDLALVRDRRIDPSLYAYDPAGGQVDLRLP